jgi:hypothetical protein
MKTINHGDLTGRRLLAQVKSKGDRTVAIKHSIDTLMDGSALTIIPERGGAAWAVPSHVVELIRAAIDRGDL